MPKPATGHGRYMAGLDGLRAVAVFAVIAYHLGVSWLPGGLLGVGVFFTLSGYLITDILTAQRERYGHIPFKDFWSRRARRLLPALWTMLIVVLLFALITRPHELAAWRGDVVAALLYVSNWWYIFHHVSYFQKFGPPSPFTHLWSLAVEEQFYLVWPLVLALGLKVFRRRWLVVATLALAVLSAVAMALIYVPGSDPSRVYYGTDTRAFALLFGAALALVWPSRKLSANISRAGTLTLDIAGAVGLAGVLAMMLFTNEYQTFLYRGGMVLLSLSTVLLIAALAHPASRIGRAMGLGPLRWLGERSYAIYLWHYPVIVLTTPSVDTTGINWVRAGAQVGASVALAALSWRFIEDPIRQGVLAAWWRRFRTEHWRTSAPAWFLTGAGVAAVSVATLGVVGAIPAGITARRTADGPTTVALHPTAHHPDPALSPTPGAKSGQGVIAIGDYTMLDAKAALKSSLPGIRVYAETDRQMSQVPAVVDALKAEGKLGTRAVIALGDNGGFSPAVLKRVLDALRSMKEIVVVNTRVPRPWEQAVNRTLAAEVRSTPRTVLVNWYRDSEHRPQYFAANGLELNPQGATAYARAIAAAVLHPPKGWDRARPGQPPATRQTAPSTLPGKGIIAIGDSVMVDAKPFLQQDLPGIAVYGKVGRQLVEAPALVETLKSEGKLGDRAIIELGTNGPFTRSQLLGLLHDLGPMKRIVLVNTRVPDPWESTVNSLLAEVAKTYPHTVLVNWYALSAGQNQYFYPDGVHLNPTGAAYYAGLLAKAVDPRYTPPTKSSAPALSRPESAMGRSGPGSHAS